MYIPGCPPTPQALLNGLIELQKKVDRESIKTARWYQKGALEAIPVPVLGPDLMDPRQYDDISRLCRIKANQEQLKSEESADETETDSNGETA